MFRLALMTLLLAPRPEGPPPTADLARSPVVAGINRFAFELFREVGTPTSNVATSPGSLAPVMALAYQGARGETAAEIARTMHFPSREITRRDLGAMLSRWDGSPVEAGYRLVAANSLWGQRTYSFKPEFVRLAAADYRAPLTQVDFAKNPDRARRSINAWVGQRTGGLIRELLSPGSIVPETRLALVNTVYFKARWWYPFKHEATSPEEFRVAPGRTVMAPTMRSKHDLWYAETAEVQVVNLAYRGGDVAMTVVLPRKDDGLADVERTITAEALAGWVARMTMRDVLLDLPKFEARTRLDLASSLAKLGMRAAFDPSAADFRGIADDPLWVGSVTQEAVVKVDEEGTEAAAATVMAAVGSAAPFGPPPPPPVVFRADHPFLYLIRDVKTGTILFLGHVVDPTR